MRDDCSFIYELWNISTDCGPRAHWADKSGWKGIARGILKCVFFSSSSVYTWSEFISPPKIGDSLSRWPLCKNRERERESFFSLSRLLVLGAYIRICMYRRKRAAAVAHRFSEKKGWEGGGETPRISQSNCNNDASVCVCVTVLERQSYQLASSRTFIDFGGRGVGGIDLCVYMRGWESATKRTPSSSPAAD